MTRKNSVPSLTAPEAVWYHPCMHEAAQFPRRVAAELAAEYEQRFTRPAVTAQSIREIMLADPVKYSRYHIPKEDGPFV